MRGESREDVGEGRKRIVGKGIKHDKKREYRRKHGRQVYGERRGQREGIEKKTKIYEEKERGEEEGRNTWEEQDTRSDNKTT